MSWSSLISRYQSWGLKAGISVLEQGFFSSANFVLSIFLARWLKSTDFGAFSLVFTLYIVITGFYNAMILEPISVLGPSRHSDDLENYLIAQLFIHSIMTFCTGLVVILIGWLIYIFFDNVLGIGLLSVGLFLPLMLLIWLVRRIYYILRRPIWSLVASSIYMIVLIVGMYLLHVRGLYNLPFWFLLMGVAGLLGATIPLAIGKISTSHHWDINIIPLISEQWLFGKWIVAATIFYSMGSQIQIFITASLLGLEFAGILKALQNLVAPMAQVSAAIVTLSIASISTKFGLRDFEGVKKNSFKVGVTVMVLAIIYELSLIMGKDWFEYLLYSRKYQEYSSLIPLVGLIPVINAMQIGYSLILRSIQKPRFYLIDKIIAAFFGILSAFLFINSWGLMGSICSLITIEIVTLATYLWLYENWFKEDLPRE